MKKQLLHFKGIYRFFLLTLLLSMLPACSFLKLGEELKQAQENLYLIKASVNLNADERIIVVLFEKTAQGEMLYTSYRIAVKGQDMFFVMPKKNYHLVAFNDRNYDYIYQQDEQVALHTQVNLHPLPSKEDANNYSLNLPATPLVLNLNSLPNKYHLDLSVTELQEGDTLPHQNYLTVTNFDDPRFSAENIQKGMWEPLSFTQEIGHGFYLLEQWDKTKKPLILVHGISSSPAMWKNFISNIDTDIYQVMLYHYPSAGSLSVASYYFSEILKDVHNRSNQQKISIIAHSMGGLVSRGGIQYLPKENYQDIIELYLTMSTPWGGNTAAQFAVETSPIIAPVWKGLTPKSHFLTRIFNYPLPESIQHIMLVSYAGDAVMVKEKNDGSVTLSSQLDYKAQQQANKVYLINADHTGILSDRETENLLEQYLLSK